MKIDEREVLRYLGYRGNNADETVRALIAEVSNEAEHTITPKSMHKIASLNLLENGVAIDGVFIESKHLRRHLRSSDKVLLFAATLGTNADLLVRRLTVTDTAKAAVAQAVLAAYIESCCDAECETLAQEFGRLTRRFSPGYGDLALTTQRDFFNLSDCTRRIGITLNDACLMLPTKSITAFIGIEKENSNAILR